MNKLKSRTRSSRCPTSSPSLAVRLRTDIRVERMNKGRVTLMRNQGRPLDMPDTVLIEGLTEAWLTEEDIDRLAKSVTNGPAIYFLCERLFSLGLLQTRCMVDGHPLFSLYPGPEWKDWQKNMSEGLVGLSHRACLRRDGPDFVLEMPLSQRKCVIHDEACLVWLMEAVRGEEFLSVHDTARGV